MADAPNSYSDPYWTQLASNTEQKLGLPDGLLSSIVTKGEKSNNNRVSDAGARTVFQITPATRKAALDKYGVDAYLSPENAAEVAGSLLKDSLDRNQGSVPLAVAEYHGGTDPANWGAKTKAYVQRVTGQPFDPNASAQPTDSSQPQDSSGQSTFDKVQAQMNAGKGPSVANVYAAYKNGQMTPEDAAAFEHEVQAGTIMLPRGATLNNGSAPSANPDLQPAPSPQQGGTQVPQSMLAAYQSGTMTQQDRQDFESLVKSGDLQLPQGVTLGTPNLQQPSLGQKIANIPSAIEESITGAKRSTPETQSLPEWQAMPEFRGAEGLKNFFTAPGFKTALGTLLSSPEETAKIIKSNYPDVGIRRDEKGNYILRSPTDGQEYAIKPGFTANDIPRMLGAITSFLPASEATTIPGMMAGSAATQAAIEGSQAATGGNFNAGDVVAAGALAPIAPALGAVARTVAKPAAALLSKVRGMPEPTAAIETPAAVREAAVSTPDVSPAAPIAESQAAPVATPDAVPPQNGTPIPPAANDAGISASVPPASVPTMTADELAQTAKKAAEGGFGAKDATEALAGQVAPDQKVVEAAKRLGIEDYLQPDHVTTNQAYRELAQAAKSIPGSAGRAAELENLSQVAKKADDVIDKIGGTQDLSTLDVDVKKALQDAHDTLKDKADDLYAQVRDAIPARSDAPAPTVISMIQQRAEDLGGAANLSPMEKMILRKLSPRQGEIPQQTASQVLAGEPVPGAQPRQPTYALLDDVRRDLTAAKYANQGPFKDSDDRLITMLEGALRTDQEAAAQRYGMGEIWNLAQKTAQTYKGMQDDLKAIFGDKLDGTLLRGRNGLGSAIQSLPAGDVSGFVRLLKSVPEDMRQEVVASGLNTAFGKNARNGQLNFSTYANWYEGLLRNKQAYTALMSNLPQSARKQLSDLYRVSRSISLATRERITTGRINAVTDQLKNADSLVANLYDAARRSTAGAAAGAAISHIPVVGPGAAAAVASALTKAKTPAIKAVDQLISSPEFVSLAKNAGTQQQKQAVLRLAYSKPFNKFVRSINQPHELSDREKWILGAMEAQNQNQQGGK